MNVAMPIAAVMLDLGFPASVVKAVPILARTASLLAHLAEEREQPLGFHMAAAAEHSIEYRLMSRRRRVPRADRVPARALALLPREAGAATIPAGSRTSPELPLTDKSEIRATVTRENPIGAHLCAEPHEIVRIYSTSGTTGTPSYIPLTARDLENWVTGSARSYAASGIEDGQRIVSTYNAGPFVAGAALAAFDRLGLTHIPVGTGNTDRLIKAIELLRPEAVVTTPSYAAYLVERDFDRSSVERVLVAGEPGGGEPEFRAKLEAGWGARVTEAMGIGDIGV